MKYRAINNYIVVDKIKEAPKMIAGMEITESQNKDLRYFKGRVIEPGKFAEVIKPGSIIWYDRHAAHSFDSDNKAVYIIKIDDVAIIEDETIS